MLLQAKASVRTKFDWVPAFARTTKISPEDDKISCKGDKNRLNVFSKFINI
jgi:hypothetical protein